MAVQLTAVLFALRREARPFLRRLRGKERLRGLPCLAWRTDRLLVVVTGMGPQAVERPLDWVLALRPARVVSAGYCGSLVTGCKVGALVAPERVVDTRGNGWELARAAALSASGTLVSVEAAVLGVAHRSELHRRTGAMAVDMETATVARRCREAGVACHGLRVVSDDLEYPLPEELFGGSIVWGLCRRPAFAADLWRLARHTRRASRVLAEALPRCLAEL